MLITILYILYSLAYAVLPFLYKTQRPAMLQFYLRMAWSRSFRRCYSLGMLATLMVFHFYHLNVFGGMSMNWPCHPLLAWPCIPTRTRNGHSTSCNGNAASSGWQWRR